MESSHSAHDAAPRLVVVSHALSEAQEAYQEARELRASTTSGQYFYKDATPRAEHYMMCTVELVGYPHRRAVPLKLSLCFDDGTLVPYEDQACLRLLKENVHVRPIISAETQVASFTYRIEIGSFRRADRSFVIRIDAEPTMASWPAPELIQVSSCLTPPIYVLSKKRLNGVVTAPSSPTMDPRGICGDKSLGKKRRRDEDDDEVDFDDIQRQLLEKMIVLERRVAELTTVVLSTVAAANVRAMPPAARGDAAPEGQRDADGHDDGLLLQQQPSPSPSDCSIVLQGGGLEAAAAGHHDLSIAC
mmetsp:Transcript_25560/g.85865  ORF Transcript_25560/g.85865 Transcript_25560/m.85865 type:complete len:303 (+) Transcript_25560:194-1102(+)